MRTYFFESTNGFNWGKFMVGIMDTELEWRSGVLEQVGGPSARLVDNLGWGDRHIWVMDLATGEGGLFRHGGLARADLNRRKVAVCLLFEPFLQWLYRQPWEQIPGLAGQIVELSDSPAGFLGYRRPGCPLGHTRCTCRRMPLAAARRRSPRHRAQYGARSRRRSSGQPRVTNRRL